MAAEERAGEREHERTKLERTSEQTRAACCERERMPHCNARAGAGDFRRGKTHL